MCFVFLQRAFYFISFYASWWFYVCVCVSIILFASFTEHKHTPRIISSAKSMKRFYMEWNMVYFGGPVKWIYRAEWRNFPRQTVFTVFPNFLWILKMLKCLLEYCELLISCYKNAQIQNSRTNCGPKVEILSNSLFFFEV